MSKLKIILSFKEAIEYLGVSKSFLYKLTSKRAITFFKPNGGKIYFKKSDLDDFMLHNRVPSISELEGDVLLNLSKKRA